MNLIPRARRHNHETLEHRSDMMTDSKANVSPGTDADSTVTDLFSDIARAVCERFDIRGGDDRGYIADTLATRLADVGTQSMLTTGVAPRPGADPFAQRLDAAAIHLGTTYACNVLASERRELKDLIARAVFGHIRHATPSGA